MTDIFEKIDAKTKRKDGKTDYCSVVPDVVLGVDLAPACKMHDFHYNTQDISRKEADFRFREHIAYLYGNSLKGRLVAFFYWLGVRIFGGAYRW